MSLFIFEQMTWSPGFFECVSDLRAVLANAFTAISAHTRKHQSHGRVYHLARQRWGMVRHVGQLIQFGRGLKSKYGASVVRLSQRVFHLVGATTLRSPCIAAPRSRLCHGVRARFIHAPHDSYLYTCSLSDRPNFLSFFAYMTCMRVAFLCSCTPISTSDVVTFVLLSRWRAPGCISVCERFARRTCQRIFGHFGAH